MELVSIIVPVYNVDKYLERCLDSICNQTYNCIELILIDDGSTDASGKICDTYMEKDTRIKVIHKKNGGLSDARNTGIDIAAGKYLTFVDSDDWIRNDYIEILVTLLEKYQADISACSYIMVNENFTANMNQGRENKETTVLEWSEVQALHYMLLNKNIDTSACAKMYRSSLFKKIRFPYGKLYEDLSTIYEVMSLSNKVVYVASGMYFYFQRLGSIQNSCFSEKKLDELEAVMRCRKFIQKYYPELKEEADCRMISSCFHLLFDISNRYLWKNTVEKLERIIKTYRGKMVFGKNINVKVRIGCLCTYLGFDFTKWIYCKAGMRGKNDF